MLCILYKDITTPIGNILEHNRFTGLYVYIYTSAFNTAVYGRDLRPILLLKLCKRSLEVQG